MQRSPVAKLPVEQRTHLNTQHGMAWQRLAWPGAGVGHGMAWGRRQVPNKIIIKLVASKRRRARIPLLHYYTFARSAVGS